jgi:hypothetical protein
MDLGRDAFFDSFPPSDSHLGRQSPADSVTPGPCASCDSESVNTL